MAICYGIGAEVAFLALLPWRDQAADTREDPGAPAVIHASGHGGYGDARAPRAVGQERKGLELEAVIV